MSSLSKIKFVSIDPKVVAFEDGTQIPVREFCISERPISVGMFKEFCEKSGYVTVAEQSGRGSMFELNEVIACMDELDRPAAPAFCVSYLDACAFCDWSGLRLPTEAEWLAAAIVDEVMYSVDDGPSWAKGGSIDFSQISPCVRLGNTEWTATRGKGSSIVCRSGPLYFRRTDWRDLAQWNRTLVAADSWDLLHTFRVCT